MAGEPWAQLPGEDAEAYRRFLCYRNVGIRRSLRRAYLHYLRAYDGYSGSPNGIRHLAPQWLADSKAFFWKDRATAWDIRNLHAYGGRVAVLHMQAMTMIAAKNARAAARLEPGDDGWADLIASVKLVAEFLTPDIVRGIQDRYKPAGKSAVPIGGRDAVE